MSAVTAKRASGSTVHVIKTFDNASDCVEQVRLMLAAGVDLSLQPFSMTGHAYRLPLVSSRVPDSLFPQVLKLYQKLWDRETPRPACTREEYHAYVLGRGFAEGQDLGAAVLLSQAKARVEELYKRVSVMPIEQHAFVHGDATISNVVMPRNGPRLIDFSPRASPPEAEIDIAKLWFSALGFDLGPARQQRLRKEISRAFTGPNYYPSLIKYYLATHLVRVLSKEPPRYEDRLAFYQEVLEYVSQ